MIVKSDPFFMSRMDAKTHLHCLLHIWLCTIYLKIVILSNQPYGFWAYGQTNIICDMALRRYHNQSFTKYSYCSFIICRMFWHTAKMNSYVRTLFENPRKTKVLSNNKNDLNKCNCNCNCRHTCKSTDRQYTRSTIHTQHLLPFK